MIGVFAFSWGHLKICSGQVAGPFGGPTGTYFDTRSSTGLEYVHALEEGESAERRWVRRDGSYWTGMCGVKGVAQLHVRIYCQGVRRLYRGDCFPRCTQSLMTLFASSVVYYDEEIWAKRAISRRGHYRGLEGLGRPRAPSRWLRFGYIARDNRELLLVA